MSKVDRHFSSSDLDRIQNAVTQAEKETSGELAVKLASHSKHWLEERLLYSSLASALAMILSLTCTRKSDWGLTYDFTQAAVWGVLGFLVFYLALGRWLRRESRRRSVVWNNALKLFSQMHSTKGQTGVLIFVSLEELQAAIVADRGIASKVPADYWHSPQAMIMDGITKNQPTDGIIAAVADIGKYLKTHFPHLVDDVNELPDRPEIV